MSRRGAGGSGSQPREVQVSKKLSWLLRHGAEKEGLELGPGGYVKVTDVVSLIPVFPFFKT
jgi:2'-phosphotransferase